MGRDYEYICKNCGKKYTFTFGIGYFYPLDYDKTVEAIKNGDYGQEWQQLSQTKDPFLVDIENRLYICNDCGNLQDETCLDIYELNDKADKENIKEPYDIMFSHFIERWAEEEEEDDEGCHLFKRYPHKCNRCNSTSIHQATEQELEELPCPNCGTLNEYEAAIDWD